MPGEKPGYFNSSPKTLDHIVAGFTGDWRFAISRSLKPTSHRMPEIPKIDKSKKGNLFGYSASP